MNVKEKKILYELSRDARQSAAQIARRVKVSKGVVSYTINKLLENKTVTQLVSLINTERLGFTRYELYLRVEDKSEVILQYLAQHPMFIWVRTALGEWDIAAEFYAKDTTEQEMILREIRAAHPTIKKVLCISVLEEHTYALRWLGYKEEQVTTKTKYETRILDNYDVLILKALSENARQNALQISRDIRLSADAVAYRIRNLVANNIIKGYRIAVNDKLLAMERYKVLLRLRSVDEKTYVIIISYLKSMDTTEYLKRTIGEWDISVTLIAKNTHELANIVTHIRERLKNNLDDYAILLLFDEYKNNYFPQGVQKHLLVQNTPRLTKKESKN